MKASKKTARLEREITTLKAENVSLLKANHCFRSDNLQLIDENLEINKHINSMDLELKINEKALNSAENALLYKEQRENDNAEFMAKVLCSCVRLNE